MTAGSAAAPVAVITGGAQGIGGAAAGLLAAGAGRFMRSIAGTAPWRRSCRTAAT